MIINALTASKLTRYYSNDDQSRREAEKIAGAAWQLAHNIEDIATSQFEPAMRKQVRQRREDGIHTVRTILESHNSLGVVEEMTMLDNALNDVPYVLTYIIDLVTNAQHAYTNSRREGDCGD